MPRPSKSIPRDLVPHPRYGSEPIPSGHSIPEARIRDSFWRHGRDMLFTETVLPANPDTQNFSVVPRRYYVDFLRTCRTCHRPFLFFAREQRYRYETLRFFVDADCVLCPACRRECRSVQRRLRRHSDLYAKASPSDRELMFLVDDAVCLLEHGVLKNLGNVGSVKNRALKVIPGYAGLHVLVDALRTSREAKSDVSAMGRGCSPGRRRSST